jgi:membrane protein YdbS with pleckstrin-like domain
MLAFMWIALGGSAVAALFPFVGTITRPALEFLENALVWVLEFGARFPAVQVGASPLAGALAILVIASIVALIYAVPRTRQRAAHALLRRARLELPCADPKTRLGLLGAREELP